MDDSHRMEVHQSGKNLSGKIFGDILAKLAVGADAACDRPACNILREAMGESVVI